ncbi:MAG TPA: FixH family protein [Anaerolineales bacterium]
MRSRLIILTLLVGLVLVLSACGGSAQSTPTPTPAPVQITFTTDPNPPATGPIEMIITVVDRQGQPITGANVDVIADHTKMGGMTMHGVATHQGDGRYAITANYGMSGKWLVTVQVKTGELDYRQDIDLQVK